MSHLWKANITSSCCKRTAQRSWTLKSNRSLCTASALLIFLFRRQIQSGTVLVAKLQRKTAWHRLWAAGWQKRSSSLEMVKSQRFCCSVTDSLRTLNSRVSQTGTSFLGEAGVLLEAQTTSQRQSNTAGLSLLWLRLDKTQQDYRSCAKYCVMYLFFADPKEEWRYP